MDWASVLASVGSALLAGVAICISVVAYRSQHHAFLVDLRQRWEALRKDWATTVLLWNPAFWYYSDASSSERARVADLQQKVIEAKNWSELVDELRGETVHVTRVGRYIAAVSDALFRGRISVRDAYAIFGPDVVRLRPAMRWAVGAGRENATAMPTHIPPAWESASDQIPNNNHYATTRDALALIDLLSAEMARVGDTRAHYLLLRAEELRTGEGKLARSRIWKSAVSRHNPVRGLRLIVHAGRAERVKLGALTSEPEPLLMEESRVFGPYRFALIRGPFKRRRYRSLVKNHQTMD